MTEETFWLDPLPPFRLDLAAWALRRRASNQIDQWDGATCTRVLFLDRQPVNVTVSQQRASAARQRARVSCLLQQMLGCATDVSAFEVVISGSADLQSSLPVS